MAGLPKKYAKMGFKKGWAAYKRSKRGSKRRSRSPRRRIRRRTTRRRTTRRRRSRAKAPKRRSSLFNVSKILSLVSTGALVAPAIQSYQANAGNIPNTLSSIVARYSGWSMNYNKFDGDWLKKGYGPYAVTSILKTAIPKIGGLIRSIL